MLFNIEKMAQEVTEILSDANVAYRDFAQKFVEVSLERKKRFFDLGFDELGRKEIPFKQTLDIICDDNPWLKQMLREINISTEHMKVINNVFYVVEGNRGMPLTKAIKKKEDKLFLRGRHWYQHHPEELYNKYNRRWGRWVNVPILDKNGKQAIDRNGNLRFTQVKDYTPPSIDRLLVQLGDIINLTRTSYISINPSDMLRSAFNGKHAAFTSCHNISNGSYKQGCIGYAMDNCHIVSFITEKSSPNLKMLGRSMVFITDDKSTVGQRRFYPSEPLFGKSRAKHLREEIHRILNPQFDIKRLTNREVPIIANREEFSGYLDAVAVWTSQKQDGELIENYADVNKDIFCFKCGNIHQSRRMFCDPCPTKASELNITSQQLARDLGLEVALAA